MAVTVIVGAGVLGSVWGPIGDLRSKNNTCARWSDASACR